MLRGRAFLGSMMLLFALSHGAKGDSGPEQTWQRAVAAFDRGAYLEAIAGFEALHAAGRRNGHVYYNLGNAYYRAGQHGAAMAAWLAARAYLPRDPDVRANLRFGQERIADKLDVEVRGDVERLVLFWLNSVTALELWWIAVVLWLGSMALLALSCLGPRLSPWRAPGWGVGAVALVAFLAWGLTWAKAERWGAVSAETTEARSGPGDHNTVVFALHGGAPFVVEKEQNGWLLVTLSDGKIGWLPAKECKIYL